MNATLTNLKKKLVASSRTPENRPTVLSCGERQKAGVTVLPRGAIQHSPRRNRQEATAQDNVTILYRVTLTDGQEIGKSEPGKPKPIRWPRRSRIAGVLAADGGGFEVADRIPPSGQRQRDPLDDTGVIIMTSSWCPPSRLLAARDRHGVDSFTCERSTKMKILKHEVRLCTALLAIGGLALASAALAVPLPGGTLDP